MTNVDARFDAMCERRQFMGPQITRRMQWVEVDGPEGIDCYPGDTFSIDGLMADQYPELSPECFTIRTGYGARMSAPGYLDCTDWVVFDTVAEAKAYLVEYYDDEDEETA